MSLLWPVEEQAMDSARRLLVRSWDQPVAFPWWPWSLKMLPPMKSLRPICWPRIWKKWLGTLNAVIEACVKRKKHVFNRISRSQDLLAVDSWHRCDEHHEDVHGCSFKERLFKMMHFLLHGWDTAEIVTCVHRVLETSSFDANGAFARVFWTIRCNSDGWSFV